MTTKKELRLRRKQAVEIFNAAGIYLTPNEKKQIEIADFGLGDFEKIGLGVFVYVNTARCCAKELAMLPRQICPEHRHPKINRNNPGKEETFRCRWGKVYLYVPGAPKKRSANKVPDERKSNFTVLHEIVLNKGQQYTLQPNTLHWFQAGPKGAVVSEFSTTSTDAKDIFIDPEITRITK